MLYTRCFVQHSIEAESGDSEGTPVAIIEAGACGLPVVSTRHAGIPDVILEDVTGFLGDERDVRTMADHMIRLARDPELAGTMGRAARQHIVAHFSLDHSIDRLWSILQSQVFRSDIENRRHPVKVASAAK